MSKTVLRRPSRPVPHRPASPPTDPPPLLRLLARGRTTDTPAVLAAAFVDDRGIPDEFAPFAQLVIEAAGEFLEKQTQRGRWHALNVLHFVAHWRARAPLPRDLADIQLLALASFYRWLGERGHLAPQDGDAIAWELLRVP